MLQAVQKHLVRGLALAALLLLSGCSTFNRDWQAAAVKPSSPASVEGRWEGKWRSDHNGHSGRLRALVTKLEDGQYEARFHANYAGVLSFGSTVKLAGRPAGGLQQFNGSADLGKAAGGMYRYEGRASATNFFSTYQCPVDHGTFQMTRPTP